MAESEEELKSLLMKVKEESGKSQLKIQHSKNEDHSIHSHHFMADRCETMETVIDYFVMVQKSLHLMTAAMKLKDACSWKRSYDQPRQHIKKQRHYFIDKGLSGQTYLRRYRNWILKKAERLRIDAFELLCWRRLLKVPWTAQKSNQSILKEISPEYSFEGMMLKLKLNILAP